MKRILKRPKTLKTLLVRVDTNTQIYVDPDRDIQAQVDKWSELRDQNEEKTIQRIRKKMSTKEVTIYVLDQKTNLINRKFV